ncbi:inositol monophosphatase family protein [Hyphomonas johnsonii]|uniref:Inositol monophosphatase family protein n=1 Tax=Hyphomonas johnsonii MHS-2 TaxID=1280950 RepID=A0A059FTB4_9PROT|nr:inositol monophosphatase family protein [Hyphomonas johnsonii]KCZ93852.1 inositol monophosphatase family protein [Hyphomonas johnsonii MHS-2]
MPAAERTLVEDLVTLRSLAIEAGQLALSYTREGQSAFAWEKTGGSPVTEADLAVNQLCAARLTHARPGYGWLSEETLDDFAARRKDRCWVVDPIDGTRAYMRGDPNWCVGLAIVEEGRAVAGVLYAPVLGHLYEARAGAGAFLNGEAIRVSECGSEAGCRLIAAEEMLVHKGWPEPWPILTVARPKPNSTLLRMAMVASGAWDATLTLTQKSDWDLAAGTILVTEAGGVATTHKGEPFQFNREVPAQRSVIASGKQLHPLLVRRSGFVDIPDPQEKAARPAATISTEPLKMGDAPKAEKQLLHIVFGGELKDVAELEFEDLSKVDFVGAFASYREAYDAWKSAAHRTVDHAEMRYFILHAHRLLDPETGEHHHV